jgi:hypothetical protein
MWSPVFNGSLQPAISRNSLATLRGKVASGELTL